MKKWKTFLKQHKLLLSKAISTMSHLMTRWRSLLLAGCVCTLVTCRVQEVPSVHSFSWEPPTCSEDSPSAASEHCFWLAGFCLSEPHLRPTPTTMLIISYYDRGWRLVAALWLVDLPLKAKPLTVGGLRQPDGRGSVYYWHLLRW